MIGISRLSYTYPDGTGALAGVSLDIESEQKLAVIGPNGAGKTTLLLALVDAIRCDGDIVVDGARLTRATSCEIRRRIGLIFQDPDDQLFTSSVRDDVAFGPRNLRLPEAEVARRVEANLARFHLADVADKPPFHLSLGQKRRASIAAALALEPDVLACDEPSSNLDPRSRRELIEFLQDFDRTLVVATHDLDLALEVTTRCVILDGGRVVADGPSERILSDEQLLRRHDLELPLCLQQPLPARPCI